MGMFKVNPAAEASVGFPTFKAGVYAVRITKVEDRNPQKNDLKVTFAYTNPTQLIQIDEQPFTGSLDAAGSLFDYVMLAEDKQWKLRSLVEACGLVWADLDPQDLVGKELDVKVGLEEYQGDQKNKLNRYVIKK